MYDYSHMVRLFASDATSTPEIRKCYHQPDNIMLSSDQGKIIPVTDVSRLDLDADSDNTSIPHDPDTPGASYVTFINE
ncbi:hypothetical protein DAPPUDRAFT_330014 [Daphnia pulex]|uniref:Uncharacterized protein n=1 Tax=Daphnia pulex TaxID=6669 RepID=E9HIA8_DAPPU|nr:hypothetical protein DAPPUDRAFT_330014 [Daphnia pulex]|eukprot:EFX68466.1 hypothetical protein DAPPUDRAFT_330014 [Daphnia pulex]